MTSRIAGTKIKVLNAFAGFGGNTELWNREKYEVTHIENDEHRIDYLHALFPDDIITHPLALQLTYQTLLI